ncbi:unnamed protein product [Rhizoctonia solani]|uniref:Uncharacterized protein n=1 Tax=Rhizoctonia solani TaxID=456999 RepID=A0A8H2W8W9_9AGAM|nr:unnamed protein product [Rhizoctonia solani]
MFSKSLVPFMLLAVLANSVDARIRIIERDGRALYGRRFGQEQNPAIAELSSACNGAICGVLAGKAVGTLLAASPECAQQDLADDVIDAAREQDATTQAKKMIDIAKRFRQAEKNTPPDFTTNPPTNRNSVFCQTPPRNAELVGLNQAQDPANNADDFFDPACKCTVKKGSQANTSPLASNATSGGKIGGNNQANKGGNTSGGDNSTSTAESASATGTVSETATATTSAAVSETATATTTDAAATTTAPATSDPNNTCPAVATVTVTVDPSAPTATATGVDTSTASVPTDSSVASSTAAASPAATAAPANGNIDLGSCSDPTIKFGAGIEGRKETSFIPNNLKEFNHLDLCQLVQGESSCSRRLQAGEGRCCCCRCKEGCRGRCVQCGFRCKD